MGTKYYVSANTCHLASASERPHQQAVVGALLQEQSLSGALLNANVNGFAKYARQFFNYAKDHYTLGLPSGHIPSGTALPRAAAATRIAAELNNGHTVTVDSGFYSKMNPLLAMLGYLHNTRKYDPATEIIAQPPAGITWSYPPSGAVPTQVKLHRVDLRPNGTDALITYSLYMEEYVIEYSYTESDYGYGTAVATMTFQRHHTEIVAIPGVASIVWQSPCLVMLYREFNGGQVIASGIPWVYQTNSNLYPELTQAANTNTDDEYLPVVPLRFNNVDLVAPATGDLYTTSKELLHKLKLDIHQIADKINENPDVGEIDHAYVMFGIDLQTEHAGSLRYLHDYFNQLHDLAAVDEYDFITNIGTPYYGTTDLNIFSIFNRYYPEVSDTSFIEHGLNLQLNYDYITSEYLPGTVGDGTLDSIQKVLATDTIEVSLGYYSDESSTYERFETQTRGVLQLLRQVEPNLIHKISVHNLSLTNYIYGGHGKVVRTSILDVMQDEDEHNLVIPVQYNLASNMNIMDRNTLYADSLIVVVNSVVKVKTKWYQSTWFTFIIIVVAIVITIYTGQGWVMELAAALEAGAYSAAAIMVLQAVAISLAINYAANWLVETFGTKLGIIGAALMAAAAIVAHQYGALVELTKEFALKTAAYMLQIAQALISSANEFLLEEGQEIVNEYADFSEKLEDRYADLKTAQELLDVGADLNPLIFTRPTRNKIVLNEYPGAFYTRCLGLVDNSMYPIHEEIPQFITARLTLPTGMTITPTYSFGV